MEPIQQTPDLAERWVSVQIQWISDPRLVIPVENNFLPVHVGLACVDYFAALNDSNTK